MDEEFFTLLPSYFKEYLALRQETTGCNIHGNFLQCLIFPNWEKVEELNPTANKMDIHKSHVWPFVAIMVLISKDSGNKSLAFYPNLVGLQSCQIGEGYREWDIPSSKPSWRKYNEKMLITFI
jgi:hypothetical protein